MTRLNQVVALELGAKADAETAVKQAKNKLALKDQMAGVTRNYQPRQEDGDTLPSEGTLVQLSAASILHEFRGPTARLFDLVATKETANRDAVADVVADDLHLTDVPVTVLLFLERQLKELRDLVSGLPVLDPSEKWDRHEPGVFRTGERMTARTVKTPRVVSLAKATEQHAEQVTVVQDDKIVGDWATVKFSGAMRQEDKAATLERIRKLSKAVVQAREEANSRQIEDLPMGDLVLEYVFG